MNGGARIVGPNVKEWRAYAQRCVEMASNSQDTKMQSMLLEMAAAWMQAAAEMELVEGKQPDVEQPK